MDVENPKGSPFQFFGIVRLFFSPKGPSFNFFDILQQFGCLKIPNGPPFQFFGIVRLFFENLFFSPKGPPFNCDKNVDNFGSVPLLPKVFLLFLSLGYGADLGRSRLVSLVSGCTGSVMSPGRIFDGFCSAGMCFLFDVRLNELSEQLSFLDEHQSVNHLNLEVNHKILKIKVG